MRFCPPNVTFSGSWENGVSECFMETVSSLALSSFLLFFGTIQMVIYWRYATLNTTFLRNSSTKLYRFQVFLLMLFPILAIGRFVLWSFVYENSEILGYMLLTTSLTAICYPFTFALMYKERHYQLPSLPSRGHGLVLLVFWTLSFVVENLAFINMRNEEWWFDPSTQRKKIEMSLFISRYITALLIFVIGLKAPGLSWPYSQQDEEPLTEENNNANRSAFSNVWKKIKTLMPYLWPKQFGLQTKVVACIILLLCGRAVKLFLPLYRKSIVDSLTETPIVFPWEYVLIFVGLSFIQGGGTGSMGLFNNLRSYLWIGVQQYTEREIQVDLFRHLHSLSLRWHLQRKTGEVLRVMDRGTDSINNLLNYIIFQIAPTLIDIVVACVFFVYAFNWWFGLIVFLTMFLYILATIMVTEWRTKFQRNMNLADNAQRARSVDSLLNFETVKYYGAENYEVQAYRKAILEFQVEEWRSMVTLNILNTSQNIILCLGLLSGSMLCVYQVAYHQGLTVGDYVLFFTYLMDLYMPLNWFGTYYRAIQKNFVDMENMFDLLKEEEEIVDDPHAKPLLSSGGEIEFSKVSFGYSPEKLVLKDVSFSVPSGKTVAIVGPSGAGKSTIVRLIFRFYDVSGGAILVDGHDIKLLQQESLRKSIGVVPQDTVLFNNTIFYNIEYGKIGSSAEEVFDAARNADIHDRILTFPERYDTKVGERGLRLSGGEKQRVAIARTLLKAPAIVLLDEATSALDTNTERNIQAALASVCTNRTTLIIAHRLSTIIHADEILVLKEGTIAERGRHEALLTTNGIYAGMWNQQLQNLEAGNGSDDSSKTADIEDVVQNGGAH